MKAAAAFARKKWSK